MLADSRHREKTFIIGKKLSEQRKKMLEFKKSISQSKKIF